MKNNIFDKRIEALKAKNKTAKEMLKNNLRDASISDYLGNDNDELQPMLAISDAKNIAGVFSSVTKLIFKDSVSIKNVFRQIRIIFKVIKAFIK